MSGGAGVHRRARIALRTGESVRTRSFDADSCAAVRRGTTPTRGAAAASVAATGRKGGGHRTRPRECGARRRWHRRRRRLSGSWVSGNVRCRDIRQPPPSATPPYLPCPAALSSFAPSVRRTNPIPATEPDRRTTGSSSSSPLIRLSRYRHRRPGNPSPSPPDRLTTTPGSPAPRPRSTGFSPVTYTHRTAARRRHVARCVGVQCTVWRGRYMRAVCTPLST